MELSRNAYRILVRKPEGKRLLGRSKHRWDDNIAMDFKGCGCDAAGWIDLAEDRIHWQAYVRMVMNLRVP